MKAKSIAAIAAAVLVVAGLIIGGIGFAVSDGRPHWEELEERTREFSDKLDRISLSLSVSDVTVKRGGDCVKIEYFDNEKEYFEFSLEGGELTVERSEAGKKRWYEYITLWNDFEQYAVTVTLPEGFEGELEAETTVGGITVLGGDFTDVRLNASTGKINVSDIEAQSISCKTSTGAINVAGVTSERDISVRATTGAVSLENAVSGGGISCNTSTGAVSLSEIKCVSCAASASTGAVRVNRVDASEGVFLKTSTGSITGQLCGAEEDYGITVSQSTGSSNLSDRAGGSRRLELRTSTGGIRIDFEK